jgi:hypothetical protein
MDPRDDEDEFPFDESDDAEPIIRELRTEMVRLQAQIDQLAAAAHERAAEIAELRVRLAELENRVDAIKARFRRDLKLWVWIAGLYGASMGLGLSWLLR